MLNSINCNRPTQFKPEMISPDDRYSRNVKEDMKSAMDLIWTFKEGLDKLHPDCLCLVERMLFSPRHY